MRFEWVSRILFLNVHTWPAKRKREFSPLGECFTTAAAKLNACGKRSSATLCAVKSSMRDTPNDDPFESNWNHKNMVNPKIHDIFRVFLSPITLTVYILLSVNSIAGLRDPFPPGFSMGTLGSIIDEKGASGREPWTSAAFCADSAGFGFALSGTSYYGSVSGSAGKDGISQAMGGGWYIRKHLVCKASIAHLNAFGAYFEQSGFISIGSDFFPLARLSLEATGFRFGVHIPDSPVRTIGEGGVSLWVPWSWAAISLRLQHLVLETAQSDGTDPTFTIRCGIHTMQNSFGGQGALVTVLPGEPKPVCFTIGEEYFITPAIAFNAAFSNNPLLISFGMAFSLGRSGAAVALVNHPVLGWSQGFGAEYFRKK